jgi:hypothetical protein
MSAASFPYERRQAIEAAEAILRQGGWCVFEVCVDVPLQCWEARVLIFDVTAEAVADAIEEEIQVEPTLDARLTGCDRRRLRPEPTMGAYLCYLAATPSTSSGSLA